MKVWLIALFALAATVALPGAALGANEAARIEKARQEIAEIKKKISAAQGNEAELKAQVDAINSQIASLDKQIKTGRHDISVLESNIRTAQADIEDLENRYSSAVAASNQRARRIYKSGSIGLIGGLFRAQSFGEFLRMSALWEVAAESEGSVMIHTSRVKGDLIEQKAELEAYRSSLANQKKWLEQQRQLVAAARGEKAGALSSLERQIQADKAHIDELEGEIKALTPILKKTLSRTSGAVSRSGYMWPLRGRINQGYSSRHPAIDIDGNTGNPIVATKGGYIGGASCSGGYGLCTIIDHGDGVATLYAHQTRKAVYSGRVEQGQVIGYVGCTGRCTGPHLHFEVRVNGDPQNPLRFLP